ncbi:hypothetical protein [Streptomyces sp. NPDC102360]|uniref:hypothetical protein n=1 Tax=Streptomyces sp. NPDC102360 TaxID=3366160 RepID=UPI00382FD791
MLIALCSLKGSPGVTTASLALAARWPGGRRPVVVECDPAGGDLMPRFRLDVSPGLVTLAAAARRAEPSHVIWEHTQGLPGGLPVVVGPVGAEQARAALVQIAERADAVLREPVGGSGTVVIVDCGRADTRTPAMEIMKAADVLLVLAGAQDDALGHVAMRWDAMARCAPRTGLLVVGDGYSSTEIAKTLGVEVLGRVPDDPKGAAMLGGRTGGRYAPARSPLAEAMARIGVKIAARSRSRLFVRPGTTQSSSRVETATSTEARSTPTLDGAPS